MPTATHDQRCTDCGDGTDRDDECSRVAVPAVDRRLPDALLNAQAEIAAAEVRRAEAAEYNIDRVAIFDAIVGYCRWSGGTSADCRALAKALVQMCGTRWSSRFGARVDTLCTGDVEWTRCRSVLGRYNVEVIPLVFGTRYVERGCYVYRVTATGKEYPICNFKLCVLEDLDVEGPKGNVRYYHVRAELPSGRVVEARLPHTELEDPRRARRALSCVLGAEAQIQPRETPHVLLAAKAASAPGRQRYVASCR